jgi:shikimate dehydrogenase
VAALGLSLAVTDAYGLFGYPVAHSWSPFIHGMFARQTQQDLSYRLYESPPERFRNDVLEFFSAGGRGVNVTVPHKHTAADLVNELTPRAQLADAVNTIILDGQNLVGDNTDGVGLVADLRRNLGLRWTEPRILLLGAGGAARGVIGPLLELNPRVLVIANRTVARADQLVREFAPLGPVSGCAFGELQADHYDLIVNATSASLRGEVPAIPASVVDALTTCYDMSYGTTETPFTNWGRVHGAERSVQGWGMLVEQAAEAFGLWRSVRPDTAPVLEALRSRMQPAH